MNGAFYIGATGLGAQQRALDVTANNIANINTPAFKRTGVRFSELVTGPGLVDGLAPMAQPGLAGVAAADFPRIYEQGDLRETGDPLSIAIKGDGLIELMGARGETLLWRGGAMKVNADGYLSTASGLPLKAMISVPQGATALTIDRDGVVTAAEDGGVSREIGRIDLVVVKDAASLETLGEGVYRVEDIQNLITATPGEDGAGLIVQGSVETSNVELADEMVMMLLVQRAYAANAQVIQAGDQLMSIANNLRR